MEPLELRAMMTKRRRGKVLKILSSVAPMAVPDADDLYRMLQNVHESLTINDVHELLRDLRDRKCLRYDQKRTKFQELPTISYIRLEPHGRDILEGTVADPAIDLV